MQKIIHLVCLLSLPLLAGLLQDSEPLSSPRPKLVPQPVTLANGCSYPAAQLIRTGQQGALYLRGRVAAGRLVGPARRLGALRTGKRRGV